MKPKRSRSEREEIRKRLTAGKPNWGAAFPEKVAVRDETLREFGKTWEGLNKIEKEQELLKKVFSKRLDQQILEQLLQYERNPEIMVKGMGLIVEGKRESDPKKLEKGFSIMNELLNSKNKALRMALDNAEHTPNMPEELRTVLISRINKYMQTTAEIKRVLDKLRK